MWRPRFDPRPYGGFMVEKVTLGRFSPIISVSSANSNLINCFIFFKHPIPDAAYSR
jgi:hypothetical protein